MMQSICSKTRRRGAWWTQAGLGLVLSLYALDGQGKGGYGEVHLQGYPGAEGVLWQSVQRFRPRFQIDLGQRVRLCSEAEFFLTQGRSNTEEIRRVIEDSSLGDVLNDSGFQWPKSSNELLGVDGLGDYLEVARLYADIYLPLLDLRIGRQAIYWGSAAILNPTDPFPELLIAEPWRPRRGVNALRANVPLGKSFDLSAVVGTDDTLQHFRAAARLRALVAETDIALVGSYRGDDEDGLVGIDIKGTLGVGYWLEVAWSSSAWSQPDLALGFDYSFAVLDSLVVMAQYYRNGRGSADKNASSSTRFNTITTQLDLQSEVDTANDTKSPATFAPILSGRDYLMMTVRQGFNEDFSAHVALLQNLNDASGVVISTLTHSTLGWLDLSLSAQIPYLLNGDGGEFKPSAADLMVSIPVTDSQSSFDVDFAGLQGNATLTLWCRASF
jgi:hypothetical protein